MIYPSFDTSYLDRYFDLNSDSIRIVQINKIDENRTDVQLIKNYSPDSNPNSNLQKSVTLNFEKCDTLPLGYKILNSTGLLDMEKVPHCVYECGALIKDKKYEDLDGIERIKIAQIIYHEKAKKVAEYLNKNVKITAKTTNFLGRDFAIVKGYKANFSLYNPTEYSCLGFTVSLKIADIMDGSFQANLNGSW